MTASEVLAALSAGGHEPTLVNGRLRIRRASALPEGLRSGIDRHVREIMDILAPADRPIDPGIAEWLAAQPEDRRREWWRSVAREYCSTRSWSDAERAVTIRSGGEYRSGGPSDDA